MYEDLIKRLQDFAAGTRLDEDAQLAFDATDAIEQLSNAGSAYGRGWTLGYDAVGEESNPRWIPVTERLPETFKHVLVNIPGMTPHPTVQEAVLEKNGMWYSNGFRYSAEEITHWMPLPAAPKEGE